MATVNARYITGMLHLDCRPSSLVILFTGGLIHTGEVPQFKNTFELLLPLSCLLARIENALCLNVMLPPSGNFGNHRKRSMQNHIV